MTAHEDESPTFVADPTIPVPPIPAQHTAPYPSPMTFDVPDKPAFPTLSIPGRPAYHTATSSDALLGDMSGANTPATPFTHNPFGDVPSAVSAANSPYLDRPPESPTGGSPPRIIIGSHSEPDSPASVNIPSFAPSPFADGGSVRSFDSSPGLDGPEGFSSAIDSKPSTMAARRSQRMKGVSAGKKGAKEKGEKGKEGRAPGAMNRKPFESTRLKGEIYKPWLEKKDPAQRWARWITIVSILIGFAVAGVCEWLDPYLARATCGL